MCCQTSMLAISGLLLVITPAWTAEPIEPSPPVVAALKWLAEHQLPDGSWDFDHRGSRCRCSDAGSISGAKNGATGMALLPFLAVGQTHQAGEYQAAIRRGVEYLVTHAKPQGDAVSFLEPQGTMYSHGLATIALCEAYRQTKDKELATVCQASLDFIREAQDPVGGGWRYAPRQRGDTSVTGWQVAALRTGQMAGLDVPGKVQVGAALFLDFVEWDGGTAYGYTRPGQSPGNSASGLVSRIHLGGKPDDEVWRKGVTRFELTGPSRSDMYFNYHASQALGQRGDEPWATWQNAINEMLVARQETEGHAEGSWHIGAGHAADRGGRLFTTSLAALVLSIHHRQLGIFQREADSESK